MSEIDALGPTEVRAEPSGPGSDGGMPGGAPDAGAEPSFDTAERHLAELLQGVRGGFERATGESPPLAARVRSESATDWSETLPQGSVRIGRFTVLERIAAGGMGVVYAAYDSQLDRKIAIKLLREGVASDTVHARIVREARAMAKLSHPNVAQVFEVGEYLCSTFIAMEFVPGVTLRGWQQEQPRSTQELLAVYVQAGRGLAAAHAEGLVHRDFKPDNAMIGRDGRVRVLDFGLVRAEARESAKDEELNERSEPMMGSDEADAAGEPLTGTGVMLGTPAYMAPEQFLGASVDQRADQFSLCVALWEALVGERPFTGKTRAALAANVLAGRMQGEPNGNELPAWVRAVLMRGLAVEPAERFESMDALLMALQADPSRRRRRILAAGLGAAAVALGIGGYGLDRARRVQACEDEAASIAEVWNDEARARVGTSLLATHKSFAASTWERVEPQLDEYAAAWSEARESTCLAAEVEGKRSEELALRTSECLYDHREALASLVEVLEDANASTAQQAVAAVAKLPQVFACVDEEGLARRMQPPADPEVRASVAELRSELARVGALGTIGRHEEAVPRATELAAQAEATGWVPVHAEALIVAGSLTKQAGKLEDAERMLEQALDLALQEGHDEAAVSAAGQLAYVTGFHGSQRERGLWWGKLAVSLAARAGAVDDFRMAHALSSLGSVRQTAGDYVGSKEPLTRALAISEATLGPDHPSVAQILVQLANTNIMAGAYGEARPQLERALAIVERAFGPEHPSLAAGLNGLGNAMLNMGDYDTARTMFERAITIDERAFGPDYVELAKTLGNLAIVHQETGDFAKATAVVERALEIQQAAFGRGHREVAIGIARLGNIQYMSAAYEDAAASFERAVAMLEKLEPDHPSFAFTLDNLASAYSELGRYAEGKRTIERALAIATQALGPEHHEISVFLGNLAEVKRNLGEHAEAKALFEQALALVERTLGPDRIESVLALRGLAAIHVAEGAYPEARALLERALAITKKVDLEHPSIPTTLVMLSNVARLEGRAAEAVTLAEQALASCEPRGVPASVRQLALARFALARAVFPDDPSRATSLAEQALAGHRRAGKAKELAEVEAWVAEHPSAEAGAPARHSPR